MFRRSLMHSGARIAYAPPNDQGTDADDLDLELDDEVDEDEIDEGQADDEVEDDAELEEVDDEDAADHQEGRQTRKGPVGRSESRYQKAEREAAEARQEAKAARERVEALEREMRAPREPQETATQRQARLDLMMPDERSEYLRQEDRRHSDQQLNALRFEMSDRADKSEFVALCGSNPAFAAVKDEVESTLREMHARGMTAPRETLATHAIGKRVLDRAKGAAPKLKKKAAENRQRNAGRPGGARSDTSGREGRLSEAQARRKRLEGMEI